MLKVTSIIVTYNHEKYITRCIESILNQNIKYDHKIFITDDCSTDNTTNICNEYVKKYPNKIILNTNKKNLGPKYNYYNAIKLNLDNDYLAYCDGDDYWCDQNKLQLQVDLLEKNKNCSFSSHNTIVKENPLIKHNYETKIYKDEEFTSLSHTSSRVIRCSNIENITQDDTPDSIMQNYLFLVGDMYYINSFMTTYNPVGGAWSGLSTEEKNNAIREGIEYMTKLKKRFNKI